MEPSAGDGSFLNLLPKNKIGIDLKPESENILKQDFFDWKPEKNKKYLTIGNHSFGTRSWLDLEFINKSAEFSEYVAFILPMYFSSDGKGSVKNRVKGLNLLYEEELDSNIFIENGKKRVLIQFFKFGGKEI